MATVTETWFTSKHDDSCLSITNYNLHRRDRVGRKGDGVCAYLRSDIKYEVLKYGNHRDSIEILWLKCYFNCQVYCVACCYHPPNPRYEPRLFVDELINGIEQFTGATDTNSLDESIVLARDFNTLDCDMLETQCGLVQIVNQPNHGANTIDKVFTNRIDCFSTLVVKSLLKKTKHLSVLVSSDPTRKQIKSKRVKVGLFDLRAHNIDYLR